MLIPASSEFIALCREQMALLSQGLGASLSVVYLTQELAEAPTNEPQLIPIVVYPETATLRQGFNPLGLPQLKQNLLRPGNERESLEESELPPQTKQYSQTESAPSEDQIVLPLIHEGLMMGLLVTARGDRQWTEKERCEVERVAQTLAIACILDKRRMWLQQQLRQQQILQEQQQDLLDNLLHQFRNPLTALRTFGKLLMKRLRPESPNQDIAVSIVRESDRLQELLQKFDEVIDLTPEDLVRLKLPEENEIFVEATVEKEGQSPLLLPGIGEETTDCNLLDILEPLLSSARAIAQERGLELITEIHPTLALVRVNKKALTEVLNNIIDNALKYTPTGGKILIRTGQKKANFQGIAISDTGPGIPTQDLEHIGERYYRGAQAETTIPGTGLGLAIAKQLIEQMQGEMEIFSPATESSITSLAQGTTFVIWLPRKKSEGVKE
ncbi:sensor histidine kinase [Calothrix rhizosoleniae]|uniref:sensor histidine kinase n=1 Tax=Calothrix rhizosoleniae TaxID=888997 RepID=UPI000B49C8F3|nr:HAMP domain-containing sensor histidine kinase [Calothrix rhizosoleniae]